MIHKVKSQKELDDILQEHEWPHIEILFDGAELRGSSRAELLDSSHAELRDSSRAVLWDSSHAELRGSSHAVLWDSSHAVLWGSSHAVLWGSSHAVLWDSSHAVLWGFSAAHQYNNTKIKKGKFATLIKPKYPNFIKTWCEMKGIKINKNRIMLWKTTNLQGKDFHSNSILYDTKKEIVCPDWDKSFNGECGCGLHLADSPSAARLFAQSKYRLFKVSANINDCVVYGGHPNYPMKLRAKKCRMVKEYPIDYTDFGQISPS